MSFERPLTIREAVDSVDKKRYLLPAIQREFVWSTGQIECLFDSLMRDYPVGIFLLWHVEKKNIRNYQFYEFIKNYHETERRHNPKADIGGSDNITAVLDGQQRLTAFYIGLKGTYAYKLKSKRWDNALAFPQRKLYLNLLKPSDDVNLKFDFRFLTEKEASKRGKNQFWFPVGSILDFQRESEVNTYLIQNGISRLEQEKAIFANDTLFKLYSTVNKDLVVYYFLEQGEELDKVLNIFIRVNSGGTKLSYSDLLLSIATAQWKTKDAREEITQFVDEINKIGDGFEFDKDFVLKTCLVLSGFSDIAFKVDNFNTENMMKIEKGWDSIATAIRLAVTLVSGFGYSKDTLSSGNALIPIAYYLLKNDLSHEIIASSKHKNDRMRIQKWLIFSLLKRAFSGTPDNVLRPIRQVIDENHSTFPVEDIIEKFKGNPKSITFTEDDIENLFQNTYGKPYTFSVLSLLYPTLDFRNKFHQDHIFPRSVFTMKNLIKKGLNEYKCEFYLEHFDYITNLQLIEGTPNQEKSDMDFKEWLHETYPSANSRKEYMDKNYIPDIDPSFDNFEEFIKNRKELMRKKLRTVLAYDPSSIEASETEEDEYGGEGEESSDEPLNPRMSKKRVMEQGQAMSDGGGDMKKIGANLILKIMKSKKEPVTIKEISDCLKAQGRFTKSYYDWLGYLIYNGKVTETKKDKKKAYKLTNK